MLRLKYCLLVSKLILINPLSASEIISRKTKRIPPPKKTVPK